MSPTRRDLFRFAAGATAALTTSEAKAAPSPAISTPPGTCRVHGNLQLAFLDEHGDQLDATCGSLEFEIDGGGAIQSIIAESPAFGDQYDVTEGGWPAVIEALGAIRAVSGRHPESIARRKRREAELRAEARQNAA